MNKWFRFNITFKIMLPIVIVFLTSAFVLIKFLAHKTKENTIISTTQSAQSTISQFKTLRAYYTNNIVNKVKGKTDVLISSNHKDIEKTIPLPATLIHDMGSELEKNQGGIKLRLYSKFPFPNRKDRKLDDYQKEALSYFESNPDGVFVKSYEESEIVRVSIADKMVAAACTNCHNSHAESPKQDWVIGEVRGVLEVETPIKVQLAQNKALVAETGYFIFSGLLAICLIITFVMKSWIIKPFQVIISKISHASRQTAAVVEQVNQSSQNVADNSSNQAMSVEQTVSSIEELSAMMAGNTVNAKKAEKKSTDSKQIAVDGAKHINTLIGSINELSNSSKKIEEFTKIVDDIAFQTNLLALNAAVEAARAGEQGKGFSVVAEAVRNLAQKSSEAAKEISTLVKDNVEKSAHGKSLADSSGKTLNSIVTMATESSEIISLIAEANQQQLNGFAQVKNAMNQIDTSVQSNSASSVETSSIADTLTVEMKNIEDLIKQLITLVEGDQKAPSQKKISTPKNNQENKFRGAA